MTTKAAWILTATRMWSGTQRHSCSMRAGLRAATLFMVVASVLGLSLAMTSCNPWGGYKNPADEKSELYQGYQVVSTADAIKAHAPADGVTMEELPAEFLVSEVTGAEFYQLQIADSAGFAGTPAFDRAIYTTNHLSATGATVAGGTWYWRARAKQAGAWGRWTQGRSFTIPYTVTYDGNGSSGGIVPVDSNRYLTGASVTVLGNTGNLEKAGYAFTGWNTASDGSGTDRVIVSTFIILGSNITLFAQWSLLYQQYFDTDVFADGNWTRTSTSLAVDTVAKVLRFSPDSHNSDSVSKNIIKLNIDLPLMIQARMRLISGGNGYTLPNLAIYPTTSISGCNPVDGQLAVHYLPGSEYGWNFGGGWTKSALNAPGAGTWTTVIATIRTDGGSLSVQLDGQSTPTVITSQTWSIAGPLWKLSFQQPWDSLCEFSYISISKP